MLCWQCENHLGNHFMLDFIALDLEGTLISTAASQIPRPGLYGFMSLCSQYATRVVIYTAVDSGRCRDILQTLVKFNDVPEWVGSMEILQWENENPKQQKDLRFIQANWPRGLLVDDLKEYVVNEQIGNWLPISTFTGREADDTELTRISEIIKQRLNLQ